MTPTHTLTPTRSASRPARFRYRGFDKSGAAVSDHIEAPDRNEAAEVLRRRGIFVSDLSEGADQSSGAHKPGRTLSFSFLKNLRGRRIEDVAAFTRQLSLLVSTGTPLVEAITSLEHQTPEGNFKAVLAAMSRRLEEGAQLSDAMAAHFLQ